MNRSATLTFEMHGYWLAGTGKGEGSGADELIARTPAGLPFLPGKTVAGLLRAAMELAAQAGRIDSEATQEILGSRDKSNPGDHGLGRFETTPGRLAITSAHLGGPAGHLAWEAWAREPSHAGAKEQLARRLSSTAVEEGGKARKRSLRTVEVTVPMTLLAEISPADSDLEDDAKWREAVQYIRQALPLLRAVGSRRSRGFGRCTVTLKTADELSGVSS